MKHNVPVILSNFLFALFEKNNDTPKEAANQTALAITNAVELLYPKKNNHVYLRNEWTQEYCQQLIVLLNTINKKGTL